MKKPEYKNIVRNKDSHPFEFMEGWTIIQVCKTLEKTDGYMMEGGLTFFIEKDGKKKRVILGYTELGEWVEDVLDVTSF